MRVKTFRGKSAGAVLAQIKKELGPEAVILSNQTKREDGQTVVEIMAAVETDCEVQAGGDDSSLGLAMPGGKTPSQDWMQEWSEIKGHLNAMLRPHMNLDTLPPRTKLAMEHLEREGVDEAILMGVYRQLSCSKTPSLLAELGKVARVKPYDAPWAEKFHLVAGPSGSGKTTALLRMALAAKRSGKDKRICLVNCDGHASKGRAILKRYAELSGLSYMEAESPEEFNVVLLTCRQYDRIFVDLPGLSPGQTLAHWLAERSMTLRDDAAVHLVLSPLYAMEQFKAYWERFRASCVKSIIWTKLDEACSFASLINVAFLTGLPASALGYGPGITNAMAGADSQALWKLIFTRQLPGSKVAPAVEMAA